MRALLLGTLIAVSLAVAAPAAGLAQGDLTPLISSATYDITATGSVSVDWTRKTGDVDKACTTWADESGSSTTSFKGRRGRFIVVSSPSFPWQLQTSITASTKRQRSWKRRYGSSGVAGCPGICPPGTAARAADGTCTPATAAPGPGKDDCGTRRTRSTPLRVQIEPRPEDDDDLTELVWDKSPPSTLMAGPPLFNSGFFRKCAVYGEGYLQTALPIRLDSADVTAIKRLRPGRTKTHTTTRGFIDCRDPSDTTVKCSLDYTTRVTIKRIR